MFASARSQDTSATRLTLTLPFQFGPRFSANICNPSPNGRRGKFERAPYCLGQSVIEQVANFNAVVSITVVPRRKPSGNRIVEKLEHRFTFEPPLQTVEPAHHVI